MRTHIVGIRNSYYETEDEAGGLYAPFLTRQLTARLNDNKTWNVSRTMTSPVTGDPAVSLRIRNFRGNVILPSRIEKSFIIARDLSLKNAFDLVRSDEEKPELISVLPVLRQYLDTDFLHEYWRNMPQPL